MRNPAYVHLFEIFILSFNLLIYILKYFFIFLQYDLDLICYNADI
jgi:hypothetical protein